MTLTDEFKDVCLSEVVLRTALVAINDLRDGGKKGEINNRYIFKYVSFLFDKKACSSFLLVRPSPNPNNPNSPNSPNNFSWGRTNRKEAFYSEGKFYSETQCMYLSHPLKNNTCGWYSFFVNTNAR